MALTKCRECGEQISSSAKACPSCGKPAPKGFLGGGCNKGCALVLLVVFAFAYVAGPSGNRSPAPTPPPPSQRQQPKQPASLGYKLASIDAGRRLPANDPAIGKYESLLRELAGLYAENDAAISDITVKSRDILREKGVEQKLLPMMEAMAAVMRPHKAENQKYAEYLAAYATLRSKGKSHEEAVAGVSAVLDALIGK